MIKAAGSLTATAVLQQLNNATFDSSMAALQSYFSGFLFSPYTATFH